MGGSYNSPMFGNAIDTAFYRLELGKDIRMLFFYCKNTPSANLRGKAEPFLYTEQLVLILCKKGKCNQKTAYSHECVVFIDSLELYFIIFVC